MSPDWLVRNLEERDYGIDMLIEVFDGQNPTGHMALIQIKGTESSFKNRDYVCLNGFPTKTLLYAELFHAPFFIFHVSLKDEMVHYVWAQKYIQCILDEGGTKWRKQGSVSIKFPDTNVLTRNDEKIIGILKRHSANREGMRFLYHYEWFRMYWAAVSNGKIYAINECLENFKGMLNCKLFFAVFYMELPDFELDGLKKTLKTIHKKKKLSDENRDYVDEQVEHLENLKMWFLDQDETDVFSTSIMSDLNPY